MKSIFYSLGLLLIITFFSFTVPAEASHLFIPNVQEDPYLAVADVMPEPVGGLEALYKKISYPEIAKRTNVEGRVYLLAYINENGGVDKVDVIRGIGGGCDEAAVKAVKDQKFTPGKSNGTNVKVKLSIPVIFKLK